MFQAWLAALSPYVTLMKMILMLMAITMTQPKNILKIFLRPGSPPSPPPSLS